MPRLRQQIELMEQRGAVKNLSDLPHHALVDHALAHAEPVPIFERPLGEADRARPLPDTVRVIEQNDRLAALRQVDGKRQSDRPRANDDHGMAGDVGARPILIGMASIAEANIRLDIGSAIAWWHRRSKLKTLAKKE